MQFKPSDQVGINHAGTVLLKYWKWNGVLRNIQYAGEIMRMIALERPFRFLLIGSGNNGSRSETTPMSLVHEGSPLGFTSHAGSSTVGNMGAFRSTKNSEAVSYGTVKSQRVLPVPIH